MGGFELSVGPPILLIHGGPGTGKSFLVSAISDRAHELGLGDMSCAYTGAAASNLRGGQTILSMLGIDMTHPGINEHLPRLSPVALARLRVAFRYDRPDQVAVIFLDEVSLVTPILLSMIDKRLKEILDSSATWGGVSMIFLGDFQQLNPVSGVALTKAVVDHLVYNRDPEKYISGTPREEGINLFVNARLIVLTEQMQASLDTQHTTMLEQLQNTDITSCQ